MANSSSAIVQKLWNYCNVLRDAGLSYGDYIEQLTYLLFLKMPHERTQPPFNQPSIIPSENDGPSLFEYEGIALEHHYRDVLRNLGREPGMLGVIFRKPQNKIQKPALLWRLRWAVLCRHRGRKPCRRERSADIWGRCASLAASLEPWPKNYLRTYNSDPRL
jgi:hypothetical protein